MSDMMKAAIFVEPGKMAVEEVPKAMLEQDDDIVIRVVRTCVCGSDLWFFRGLSGQAAHSQVGHEAIGVVEETGAAVESVKPGDFVVRAIPVQLRQVPGVQGRLRIRVPARGLLLRLSGRIPARTGGGRHRGQGARFAGRLR